MSKRGGCGYGRSWGNGIRFAMDSDPMLRRRAEVAMAERNNDRALGLGHLIGEKTASQVAAVELVGHELLAHVLGV